MEYMHIKIIKLSLKLLNAPGNIDSDAPLINQKIRIPTPALLATKSFHLTWGFSKNGVFKQAEVMVHEYIIVQ